MNELRLLVQIQLADLLRFAVDNSVILTVLIPAIAAWIALITAKPFRSVPAAIAILATLGGLAAAILTWAQAFSNPVSTKLVLGSWSLNLLIPAGAKGWQLALTFRADALTATASVMFSILFVLVALQTFGLRKAYNLRSYQPFLLLLAAAGANGAALAGDLLTLYLSVEMLTLACAALLLAPLTPSNVAAARKLFSASIGLSIPMLFSILWILNQTGTLGLRELWAKQMSADFTATGLAIAVILIALALKAGIVPLHAWLVRGADSAISPVGLILTSVLTQVGAYSLIRIVLSTFDIGVDWRIIIAILGAITAIISAIGAIQADGHKKSLAYLAIGQMGFILVALGAATPLGDAAALSLVVSFSIYFPLLYIAIQEVHSVAMTVDGWRQVMRLAPLAFAALIAGTLGIAGVPPLNGFTSYLLIYQTLLSAGTPATQVILAASFIATGLTAAAAINMLIRSFDKDETAKESVSPSTPWTKPAMIVLGILSMSLGFMPNMVLTDLVRPMTAAARIVPILDIPTHADTLVLVESFVLFVVAATLGLAAYLWRKGFLQETTVPYARPISTVVSLIRILAPAYRALNYFLQRNYLDAYAGAAIVIQVLANIAHAIIYLLALRYVPESEDEWEQEPEVHVTEPRAAA